MEIRYYIAARQKNGYQVQAPKTSYIKCLDKSQTIHGVDIDTVFLGELGALYQLYQVAKTGKEDFLIFQQDRRFFTEYAEDKQRIKEDFLDNDTEQQYGLCRLDGYCEKYDILLPSERKVKHTKHKTAAAYMDEYEKKYGTHRFGIFCKNLCSSGLVKQDIVHKVRKKNKILDLCLFGMKREYFLEFCEWMFAVIARTHAAIDRSHDPRRRLGDYSQWAAFALQCYVESKKEVRAGRLPVVAFRSARFENAWMPAFSERNLPIVLSSSDFYVIYLSAMLWSVIEHSSKQYNYDITILESGITDENKKILKQMAKDYPNVSIRFYNVCRKMSGIHLKAGGHISVETYYRLLIPQIFEKYKKILYLDSDMTVHADVAELFSVCLDGYMVAAAHDMCIAAFCNGSDPTFLPYCINKLGIEEYWDYFQAGVMLLNLERFREKYTQDEIFAVAEKRQYRYVDQDIMNVLCKGEIRHLPLVWNCFPDMGNYIYEYLPYKLLLEYKQARKAPKICHHTGPVKPWQEVFADSLMTDRFWAVSRKTPYFEHVFTREVHGIVQSYFREYAVNRPVRRALRWIKNRIVVPFGKIFIKKDTKLYKKIQYTYYHLRGIELPTWQLAMEEEETE